MITKTAIVLALLVGAASTVLAAPKHSNNSAYDVYSTSGKYLGSDPDPTIRSSLARDHGY